MPDSDTRCALAVQGLGAGAITSSVQTVMSDLVTLRERGTFSGFLALLVPVLRLVQRLLMDRVQFLGGRWRCWSSNWRIIGSERALVCNLPPGIPASCFSSDRFSLQEMAVLCVLVVFVSSFQRVVNRVQTSIFLYAHLMPLLSYSSCVSRHHMQL
jgi:MFS family permease